MPDIKHNFTGGKMNKDLDERLVPNGEYRDAMNIQVQTSEGSDVGTIQNILGNNFGCDYNNLNNPIPVGSTTVGSVSDEKNDSLYWLVAGADPALSWPISNSVSFKDMIMRTNKSTPTGCEPVFVDLWKYCTEISPLPGFSDNSISLLDSGGYGVVTPGMYATGYSGSSATPEFGPTLVTGVGNYNLIPMNYNIGIDLISAPFTPPTIEIGDVTNTSMFLRGFWNDNGGAAGTGGYTDIHYDIMAPVVNKPIVQLNLPPNGSVQFWIPASQLTAIQASHLQPGVTVGHLPNVLPQAWHNNNGGAPVLNGFTNVVVDDVVQDQIFDQNGVAIDAYILTITTDANKVYDCWSEQNGTQHGCAWWTGIWQKNASISAGFQNGEAYPFYDLQTNIIPNDILAGPTPSVTIEVLQQTVLDEIFQILWDFDGTNPPTPNTDASNNDVQLQVNSSFFPPNSCIDPDSVIDPLNGFTLGPPITFNNVFEVVDCDTGTPSPASDFNTTGELLILSTAVADGVMKVWLQDEVDLSLADSVCFEADKTLNFEPNKLITGINIIDDMLFWTDGYHDATNKLQGTEPKKINIKRSIQGTNIAGMTHTDLYVDGANEGPTREEHITVIRKAPSNPPTLEMTSQIREGILGGIEVLLKNTTAIGHKPFDNKVNGDSVWVVVDSINGEHPNFNIGDILRVQAVESGVDFNLPKGYHLRLEVIQKQPGPFNDPNNTVNATGLQTAYLVRILTIADELKLEETDWYVELEEGDSLFERKFPRFAYRYKYIDNEYSSFGPFSEVAFVPGDFDYAPIEAYNIGMINRVKSLIIKDFVSNDTPKDVVQIDILYKNETSPTVYLLDSVARNDSTNNWNTSSYEVSTESVFGALPTSQILRSWDNVPKTARAQEITGNRLIYGNYLQGYDIKQNQNTPTLLQPSITTSLASRVVDSVDFTGKQSIKSLRTYDVGVVWGDKYGRETPVITSTGSSLTVPKSKSLDSSYLVADISVSPHWADYYRFYVKETSNEYYNLPVDRIYDAEDGNIWVSFPSVDRNKVDEDTYIILKKGIDSDELILEDAKYKIVAIENEAPEYIKTTYERLVRSNTDSSRLANSCNMYGGSALNPCDFSAHVELNAPEVGMKSFTLMEHRWAGSYSTINPNQGMGLTSPVVLWEEVKENSGGSTTDELFVSFTKEITDANGFSIPYVSNKYHVVSVERKTLVTSSPNPHYYDIKLKTPILSADDWIVGGGDMAADNIHQHFWKKTVRNKPEFDGRFFVKILNDNTTKEKLKSKVGSIGNWKVDASLELYKIDDPNITPEPGDGYDYANGGVIAASTRTATHWNTRLKFGSSSTKSEWFIDGASFASKQMGDPYAATGNYAYVETSFHNPTSGTDFDSCDTDSDFTGQQLSAWCGNLAGTITFDVDAADDISTWLGLSGAFDIDVGTGASKGLIGMKGVHESGGAKYFDLAHSKIGPQGPTGNTTNYTLGWEEADNEAAIVSNLDTGKRFRLQGDDVIYKILGVTKHRLFNYQGKKTASPASVGGPGGLCDTFWNNKQDDQVALMGNPRNRRVTYRINYDIDIPSSPPGTDPLDTLEDNLAYSGINETTSARLYFVEEFTTEGENPISKNPAIFETEPKEDVDLDLYYEASSSLPTFPITERNKHSHIPVGATIIPPPTGNWSGVFPEGVFIAGWEYIDPSSPEYIIKLSTPLNIGQFNFLFSQPYLVLLKDNGEIVQAEIISGPMSGGMVVAIKINPISRVGLSWFNCWSFNNGVESNRVGDTFNKPFLTNGATVSTTTEERFKEEHRKYGLIYSGLYNSNSGINSLNEFIQAEKITKDINPTYGSIQKLHSGWGQGGDLVTLCEDRILKILANKDALYNADGNSNITSTNNVLGQAIPYSGEFGISKNPESFASDAYRAYFTDKVRGTVMRLSMDGLTPISEHGMKDWFRDNLKLNSDLVGSYDDRQDEYNVTLPITTENSPIARTVSFSERVKGWVSFKSFVPENGISCANDYYTFKDGSLYKHHDETVDRNTFYPTIGIPGKYTDSSFTVLINESPGSVKTFHTLNYEGSQSKIDQLVSQSIGTIGAYDTFIPGTSVVDTTYNSSEYYNLSGEKGWYVQSIKTDLEEGSLNEFIEKEGKWFNYIKGIPGSITDGVNVDGFDNYNVSFQGLGRLAGTPTVSSVYGCTACGTTDSSTIPVYTYPWSTNCNPAATIDDGSCIATIVGCTDSTATVNYDPTANWDIWTNTGILHPNACQHHGCTDPLATNYDANANYNDGSCFYPVIGCTDNDQQMVNNDGVVTMYPMYSNFNINANLACDGVNDLLQPCVTGASGTMQSGPNCCCSPIVFGCTDPIADNFDANANTSDNSCVYIVFGCLDAMACEYAVDFGNGANTDDGSCTWCGDVAGNNYDGDDGFGDPLASCNAGCVFCKDPINFQLTGSTSHSDIEVSWQEVIVDAPVDTYKIRYRITGSSDPWTTSAAGAGGVNGNTINYGISGLTANTSYDIQLKAVCVAGQSPLNPTHYTATAWSSTLTETTTLIPVPGCMDGTGAVPPGNPIGSWPACNYNSLATVDDGSCEYNSCHGCTDSTYQEFCDTCWDSVNQVPVTDSSGTDWLGQVVGDCITPWVLGCMDPSAINWDPAATQDDGSCIYPILGCMDNTTLTHDGSMQSPNSGGLALATINYDGPGSGTVPEANTPCNTSYDNDCCNYNMPTFSSWYGVDPSEWVNSNNTRLKAIWDIAGIPQFDDTSMSLGFSNAWNTPTLNYQTASGANISNPTPTTLQVEASSSGNVSNFSNPGNNGDFSQALVFVFNNPNIPTYTTPTETFTVQNLPGCGDPIATCNYPTDPALLATFSDNSTCIYPSGCSDPLSYNYDAAVTCGDPSDCVYCETDPDVANATLTTITANNTHTINWVDMGSYNTNGTNTDEVDYGWGLVKPAYEILYKYKPSGGSWTSSWATMNPVGTTNDTIPLPAPCNGNSGRRISPSGILLSYTDVGISGSTGAFNTGAKWKLKVRNYCTDCSDGGYITTPILEIL